MLPPLGATMALSLCAAASPPLSPPLPFCPWRLQHHLSNYGRVQAGLDGDSAGHEVGGTQGLSPNQAGAGIQSYF